MSSSEGRRRPGRAALALGLTLACALSACTVHPLYEGGTDSLDLKTPASAGLAAARGRIGVSLAGDRTAQIARNALLFGLNGGAELSSPLLYEVRASATGYETVVSIQTGSGVPDASLYRVTLTYSVVRIADSQVIAQGTRFASAPFDRSEQLFAASRALLDARETAAKEAAERVVLAVSGAIAKDLR